MQLSVHRSFYTTNEPEDDELYDEEIEAEPFNAEPQYETTLDKLLDTKTDDGTPLLFLDHRLLVVDSKEENED